MLRTQTNILDEVHSELDPTVFDKPASTHPVLKPTHSLWIKKSIYATLEQAGYNKIEDWLTLVLTGSLTTYQFSPESDCDVSLFVDSVRFPEWSRAEMIAVMVEHMDGKTLPGTTHPMQDFVVGEGIKPSDLYKPGLRSGYNIDNGKWIVPPEHARVHDVKSEQGGFYAWALQMADKMERLLKYEPDQAIEFWHAIHKKRQQDMARGKGDFSESNIIYKMLSKRGLFPEIAEYSGEYIAKTASNEWTPGQPGKCFKVGDQVHAWNTDAPPDQPGAGAPHHAEKQELLGYPPYPFPTGSGWIHPNGDIEFPYGDSEETKEVVVDNIPGTRRIEPHIDWNWESNVIRKKAAKTIYHEFRPDPPHPKEGNKPTLPWIYDPRSEIVHLGPAEGWHWQIIQRVPELQDRYGEEAWSGPSEQARINPEAWDAPIHGAMTWPDRELKMMNDTDPQTTAKIADALGTSPPDHQWNFSSIREASIS